MNEVNVEAQQPRDSVEATESYAPSALDLEPALAEARSALQAREAALAEAKGILAQRDVEVQALRQQLTSATARYRQALLAASPEIPEELVAGNTPEDVEASLARARQMVERIRSRIEAQIAEQRVPTGAPIRSAQDLSGLSPQEKIAYALSQDNRGR